MSAPKTKKYFDVVYESTVPATITFRILAEDPEEAERLSRTTQASPVAVKYHLARRKNFKLKILDAGTTMIRLLKNITS